MNRPGETTNGRSRDLERLLIESAPEVECDPPPELRSRILAGLRTANDLPSFERSRTTLFAWSVAAGAAAVLALLVSISLLRGSDPSPELTEELSVASAVPRLPEGELTFLFEPFVGEARLFAADLEAAAEGLRSSFPHGLVFDAPESPEKDSSER